MIERGDTRNNNNMIGTSPPSNHNFQDNEQVNIKTITRNQGILTRLIKQLVRPYRKRRICQSSKKKDMIWLEPSDTSSLVDMMKSFFGGKKKSSPLQETRVS